VARYLLDTNVVSYLADTASPFHAAARDGLAGLADGDEVGLSVLSLYELHHWFAYRPADRGMVEELARDFAVLPLPGAGAARFGALMRGLRGGGLRRSQVQRHALDCMIAAAALERGAALVTGDALFARLAALEPELRVVSWTGG
jgi:predicted nucleic acid-binding protein